jgi:hypothetical protein
MEQQLQWRRDKLQKLCSKGYSQKEISQTLQIGLATIICLSSSSSNRNISISSICNNYKTNKQAKTLASIKTGSISAIKETMYHDKIKEKRYRHYH